MLATHSGNIPRDVICQGRVFEGTDVPMASLFNCSVANFVKDDVFVRCVFSCPKVNQLFVDSLRSHSFDIVIILLLACKLTTLINALMSSVVLAVTSPHIEVE